MFVVDLAQRRGSHLSATSSASNIPPIRRITTAQASDRPNFLSAVLNEIPLGLVLNLGAGATTPVGVGLTAVNVDHAIPGGRPEGLFVVADAAALPFRDRIFDGTLAKDVLEHVAHPVQVLQEMRRTSRSHAVLIVTVPRAVPRAVWDDPTHVRGFTARALTTALELAEWNVRSIRRIGGFPGAGRLGLTPYLETIMTIPILGHWLGTNWLVRARPASGSPGPNCAAGRL